MKPHLIADENASHRLVPVCLQLQPNFPIVHISEWNEGAYLSVKDPALLMALREKNLLLVGFDPREFADGALSWNTRPTHCSISKKFEPSQEPGLLRRKPDCSSSGSLRAKLHASEFF